MIRDTSIGNDSKEGSRVGCSIPAQEPAENSCILGLMECGRTDALILQSRQAVKHRLVVREEVGDGANVGNRSHWACLHGSVV